MTDMARLRAGRVGGQFWSVYIEGTITGDEAIRETIEQIDIVQPHDRRLSATTSSSRRPPTTSCASTRAGKIASLIGIEGGRQIGGSLAALRQFYNLGARYMTLTHNQTTEWADSATDEPKHDGLSPFGRRGRPRDEPARHAGRPQPRLAPATMKDAIAASRAPVIFSHSRRARARPSSAQRARRRAAAAPGERRRGDGQFRPAVPVGRGVGVGRRAHRRGSAAQGHSTAQQGRGRGGRLKAWDAGAPGPGVTVGLSPTISSMSPRSRATTMSGSAATSTASLLRRAGLTGVEDYPACSPN